MMQRREVLRGALSLMMLGAAGASLVGCDSNKSAGSGGGASSTSGKSSALRPGEKPLVIVTTTMLASAASEIGGDEVVVEAIMKPGGDPHLYQPTPSDARRVSKSALVITSGLHLEGWLDALVKNAGGERPVIVASEGVNAISMEGAPGGVDPHFWFDLSAWGLAVDHIEQALRELVGAESEAGKRIAKNAATYRQKIGLLEAWTRAQIDTIPEPQRVLITSHDAFNYFGRAYGVTVMGIQGASTEQAASQRDVVNVIERVKQSQVPAIFIESSVNPSLIEQVARETGVQALGPLYSDSVGMPDSKAADFVGMFSENVRQITRGLGGEPAGFDIEAMMMEEAP